MTRVPCVGLAGSSGVNRTTDDSVLKLPGPALNLLLLDHVLAGDGVLAALMVWVDFKHPEPPGSGHLAGGDRGVPAGVAAVAGDHHVGDGGFHRGIVPSVWVLPGPRTGRQDGRLSAELGGYTMAY